MSDADITAADGAAVEATVNPGELLAQAREKAKLSTADVARQLKLSIGQVEALEAGQFERLPGSVFVRGFIRNYARLVKLDPDHLLAAAGDRLPRHVARPEAPPSQNIPFPSSRPRRWAKYAWTVAVILVALAAYEFLVSDEDAVVTTHPVDVAQAPNQASQPTDSAPQPADTARRAADSAPQSTNSAPRPTDPVPKPSSTAPKTTSAASEPSTASAPVVQTEESKPDNKAVSGSGTADNASLAKDTTPVAPVIMAPETEPATMPSADSPAPQVAPPPAQVNPNEKQATLVFEDESWVEIRDRSGKVIHWQLNPAGTRQVVRGTPPMSFVIGNAHGVRLTFDERPVDLAPYTRTDVARLTLK